MELGYIYLLTCNSNKVYVGSCKNIKERFWAHIKDFKIFNNINYKSNKGTNSYLLFIDGNVKIHILEEVKYKEKNELLEREKYWINNYKNISNLECVNKIVNVVRTLDEYKKYKKQYHKEYYKNNKDALKKYMKQYNQKNKDYIIQYQKDWYLKNKEIINEKTICNICNKEITKIHLNRHNKTKTHLNNLAENKI